jgi:hypothetical protein
MSSLKSFLYGVAPIIGITPNALYERQRALVKLGLLTAAPGRGPGSGVPLTAENIAAVVISVLAAENLSDVDDRVVDLCKAQPEGTLGRGEPRKIWEKLGKPTFLSDVARVLSGQNARWRHHDDRELYYYGIRVSRIWRGQIIESPTGASPITYFPDDSDKYTPFHKISITAEIEDEMLSKLVTFTQGALSQAKELEEEDEQ